MVRHDDHGKIAGLSGSFESDRIGALAGQFEDDVLTSVLLSHP